MAHKRIEIKRAIASAIKANPVLSKIALFTDREGEIWEKKSPIIHISVREEFSEKFGEAPRILKRKAMVAIEIAIQDIQHAERVEEISKLVEDQINKDLTLSKLVTDTVLAHSDFEIKVDGARPVSTQQLIYEIIYYTDESPELSASPTSTPVIQFRR
ncbi:MAG: hypothetical protein HRU19_32065 [Pseudobacteriovorax sp.]|nr:hypothetical protein [Pseudobacteriovorax sp.]